MDVSLPSLLLGVAMLLLASVLASKASSRFGVPALLLFLAVGMLAGSDGPGGIAFDYPRLAQSLGIVALAFILFGGGLDTQWEDVRPVLSPGLALATVGVVITGGLTGLVAARVLGWPLLQGLLLGAIVSSTDAAAVFAVLRSRNVRLPDRLRSLLELESGSNDPMAVFLTVALIGLLVDPQMSAAWLPILFVRQMTLGGLVGYGMGRTLSMAVNRLRLEYEGLYPALTIALVLLTYALTDLIGGNGFLAVYVAGIVMRRAAFIHKRSLIRFHDGIAWLMQIVMFLTLGLQVFPSRLPAVAASGFAIALFLMFIGRPVAVFLTLAMSHIRVRERALIAWVGLRGAAPIILATFPLVAGVERASQMFSVVFFIVFTSALIQGTSVPWMTNLLRLSLPETAPSRDPFDVISTTNREILEFQVQAASRFTGQRVLDLGLPDGVLMVLIDRQGVAIVPSGSTVVLEGDKLLVLTGPNEASAVRSLFQA